MRQQPFFHQPVPFRPDGVPQIGVLLLYLRYRMRRFQVPPSPAKLQRPPLVYALFPFALYQVVPLCDLARPANEPAFHRGTNCRVPHSRFWDLKGWDCETLERPLASRNRTSCIPSATKQSLRNVPSAWKQTHARNGAYLAKEVFVRGVDVFARGVRRVLSYAASDHFRFETETRECG